ncbi:MAG TPA: hypothetical protein VFQ24_11445 [Terriglobia bacterium]|nr:hypothetical protein [Terriglobia bacterium]
MGNAISALMNRFIACGAGRADLHAAPEVSLRGPLDCNPVPIQTISAGHYLIVMGNLQKPRQLASRAGIKE